MDTTSTSYTSTKRTMDVSGSDDDGVDGKRRRPNFLNDVEQTLLLAHLNDTFPSTSSYETESKRNMTMKVHENEVIEAHMPVRSADSAQALQLTQMDRAITEKKKKKTRTNTSKTIANNVKKRADSLFSSSSDVKPSVSRTVTLDSSQNQSKTSKLRAPPLSGKASKEFSSGSPKPKPEGALSL